MWELACHSLRKFKRIFEDFLCLHTVMSTAVHQDTPSMPHSICTGFASASPSSVRFHCALEGLDWQ